MLGKMWTKYSVLDHILPDYKAITDELLLYIDLRSIFGILYTDNIDINKILTKDEKLMVSAEILNMIAHYRNYFWARHKIKTTFIFIYSDEVSERNQKLNPDYNSNFKEKRRINGKYSKVQSVIKKNIDLLKILAPKIPNIYFVDTKKIEPECIPLMLKEKNEIGLLLTNNSTFIRYLQYKNFHILTMKSDSSKIIRDFQLEEGKRYKYAHPFQYLAGKTKASENLELMNFPIKMVDWVFAISGSEKHSIKGYPGLGFVKALKLLKKCNLDKKFGCNEEEFLSLIELPDDTMKDMIVTNKRILNLKENLNDLSISDLSFIENQLENTIDGNSLQKVNNIYFRNSIKLGYLFQGY